VFAEKRLLKTGFVEKFLITWEAGGHPGGISFSAVPGYDRFSHICNEIIQGFMFTREERDA
jgi:hypothetical protein